MEKEQRNRLQKATQDARKLLEEEFRSQLLQTYDIDVEKVRWAEEPGAHLQAEQRLIRDKLVAWIEHKEAQINDRKEALLLALREMAFTALNRFVALKLMEARELVRPCVSGGLESAGFLEFTAVAQGLLADQESSYRLYLETIFEDVSRELRALFDPRDPASLLWPKRTALLELLDILNRPELAELWIEDEALGWIYQYFNGNDVKQMRDAAKGGAPRNSRELAVRNQFFTPRYVVEFLVDNTLGRIWYDMRKGDTRLKDRCRYMVRRPKETWLNPGEDDPIYLNSDEALSQEELLRQPVQIARHPFKDPREIRLLDPACGSMHFGLYAFDLYVEIYEEAWDIAQCSERQAEESEAFGAFASYAARFADKASFLQEVPRLILQHNIHGIDIDPRATQIARLTLWLRAQREWKEQHLKVGDRPPISRSNVVCAEPMPGEQELLSDFIDHQFLDIERGLIRQLLDSIFDKMKLAGQAGSLLRIEDEISNAIEEARREWQRIAIHQKNLFSPSELAALGQMGSTLNADLEDLTIHFWSGIEDRIYTALRNYAELAQDQGGFQQQLFAEDAVRGFAFIDITRKRFDVVVMNPPFGEHACLSKPYVANRFPDSGEDIDAAFVSRGRELLTCHGRLGVIANRTQFFKGVLKDWRERLFLETGRIDIVTDLGYGVLDGAVVEAAAYTLDVRAVATGTSLFVRALDAVDKELRLKESLAQGLLCADRSFVFVQKSSFFRVVPGRRLAYWITPSFSRAFTEFTPLEGHKGLARQGLASADNFRFLRLAWEIALNRRRNCSGPNPDHIWADFAKGGDYSPYFQDLHLVINWAREGRELCAFEGSVIRNPSFYFKEAITYSERTASGFSPRALPAGAVFDSKGPIVAAVNRDDLSSLLGLMMSRVWATFLEFLVAAGDSSVSGTAARQYTQSIVGSVPMPDFNPIAWAKIGEQAKLAWIGRQTKDCRGECSRYFIAPLLTQIDSANIESFASLVEAIVRENEDVDLGVLDASYEIEAEVRRCYGLDEITCAEIDDEFGQHPISLPTRNIDPNEYSRLYLASDDDLVSIASASTGGRRAATKLIFLADRRLELLALHFNCNARNLVDLRRQLSLQSSDITSKIACEFLSYALGCVFGRWDVRYMTGEKREPQWTDLFAPAPTCPPGMLLGDNGLPLSPEEGHVLTGNQHYPLEVAWGGILADDSNSSLDIQYRLRMVFSAIWKSRADIVLQEVCSLLGISDLRGWFSRPAAFFADHLSRYSKSRRQAPIYWQLSAGSGSYSAWLYYHRFTQDTLYRVLRDFVEPRIQQAEREQFELESQGALSGDAAIRLQEVQNLLQDLRILKSELDLVATALESQPQ
jgi:hypothetical protein